MKTQLFVLSVLLAAFPLVSTFGLSLPVSTDTFTTIKAKVAVVTAASGKATTLTVTPTQDALVFFDLNGLPPAFSAVNVIGARLRFYVAKVTKPGDLAIHRALDPWDEDKDGPAPSTDANPIATVVAAKLASKRFVVVDVTPTVQAWLATPTSNHGLAIIAAGNTPTLKATLGAKEGPGIGQPAELEIEVNAAGGVYQNADPTTGKLDGQQVATGTIGNSQLANPSFTLNAGTGLSGGGAVALGGMVTLNNTGVTSLTGGGGISVSAANGGVMLGSNATTTNTPDTIVLRDGSGNFTAGTITATLAGNATSATSAATATSATTATTAGNFTGLLAGDVTGLQGTTVVANVGGVTAANVAAGANLANAATTASIPNSIVKRDANGDAIVSSNFAGPYANAVSFTNSANNFTGALTGTADSNLQGNIVKNPALGMLLYHASFSNVGTSGQGIFAEHDGTADLTAYGQAGGIMNASGAGSVGFSINQPGAFLSARARWASVPDSGSLFYVLAGDSGGLNPPTNGFGFKADGSALKGVTIDGGPDRRLRSTWRRTFHLALSICSPCAVLLRSSFSSMAFPKEAAPRTFRQVRAPMSCGLKKTPQANPSNSRLDTSRLASQCSSRVVLGACQCAGASSCAQLRRLQCLRVMLRHGEQTQGRTAGFARAVLP